MTQIYSDSEVSLDPLKEKKIVLFGYGSQGRAQALNLKESGLAPFIHLRSESLQKKEAEADRFEVVTNPEEAAGIADIAVLLLPDDAQEEFWKNHLQKTLRSRTAVLFAHGFNIVFNRIAPRTDLDIILLAPRATGKQVRSLFQEGKGAVSLFAVGQDFTGQARAIGLAYAKGIGSTRAAVIESSFKEETVTNLFSEQTMMTGGILHLMQAGFETLVEAGYSPEAAYLETVTKGKLLMEILEAQGFQKMREAISKTAEYGDRTRGPRVITAETKKEMRKILSEIESGEFAKEYLASGPLKKLPTLLIDQIGEKLRRFLK